MSARWIYSFAETPPGDARQLLGGKGASLAEMTRAGLNVPPGFTITTAACQYFYEHNQQWPEGLEAELREQLAALERAVGRKFGAGPKPLFVSVRSGAAVSMPGMMDTILNCGITERLAMELGNTPQFWYVYRQFVVAFGKTVAGMAAEVFEGATDVRELLRRYEQNARRPFPQEPWTQLVECINAVFRSWNSERAIAYRKRNQITGLAGTAVNVQAMFPSEVSGIVFTQDPNHLAAQQMVIESSFGLGEAVVSGEVTPDRFLVKRDDFTQVQTFPGQKTSAVAALGNSAPLDVNVLTLTPHAIRELAELCLRVERHFGAPMDIEWGWAEGQFALLQCRTIRGLDLAQNAEEARQEEILRLRELAGNRRRVWVAHNLRETLRTPTPLTWDIVRQFMSGDGGFGQMYQDFGYRPSREVRESGFLELILGRIYADPERMAQLFWGGLPMAYDVQAILRNKNELDQPPTKFDPEKADEKFLLHLPGALKAMFRVSRTMKRVRPRIQDIFEREVLPPYLDYVRAKRTEDLTTRSTAEVLRELADRRERVLTKFGKESLKPPYFAGLALGKLEATLAQVFGRAEGVQLTKVLTMGLDHDTTYEQDLMLTLVAKGEASWEEFVEQYGHRAVNEMELSEPRWREDQTFLKQVTASLRVARGRSLEEIHRDNARKAAEARAELPARLRAAGGSALHEEIEEQLAEARALLPYRETGKFYLMMGYEVIRLAIVELARRWQLGTDIFYLHVDELDRFEAESADLKVKIAQRKTRWKSVQRLDLPDVIDSEQLDRLGLPPEIENANELTGDAVSPGVATGTARLVFHPREVGDLGKDYVLVCPSTDPGWTPLFVNARALVVERGGILSHGAIVARDFGIPAVVCPRATTLLKDGETIRVDGNHGKIARLPA